MSAGRLPPAPPPRRLPLGAAFPRRFRKLAFLGKPSGRDGAMRDENPAGPRPDRPSRRRFGWLAGAVAAALLAPVSSAGAEVRELRLAYQYGFIYLPMEIAAHAGLVEARAKELGVGDLKVTAQRFSGTPAMNEALISGNVDMGALG